MLRYLQALDETGKASKAAAMKWNVVNEDTGESFDSRRGSTRSETAVSLVNATGLGVEPSRWAASAPGLWFNTAPLANAASDAAKDPDAIIKKISRTKELNENSIVTTPLSAVGSKRRRSNGPATANATSSSQSSQAVSELQEFLGLISCWKDKTCEMHEVHRADVETQTSKYQAKRKLTPPRRFHSHTREGKTQGKCLS